jgi:uncharacterized membrane protein YobD (UPF0266 family)
MVKLLQWCTRVAGIFALILGVLIGRVGYSWLPRTHTVLGIVVVVALFLIAIFGFFARLPPVLPIVGVFWAGATLYLGYAQFHLMTGDAHWIIELAHALLGIGAIGLAEAIGARISRQRV